MSLIAIGVSTVFGLFILRGLRRAGRAEEEIRDIFEQELAERQKSLRKHTATPQKTAS